jgi:precorrin-6A/cobalt-precorrin-6A reductase
LLEAHGVEVIVAKNSGGAAAYGKIAAARALGLRVIVLRRPALPEVAAVETVDEVLDWLDHVPALAIARGV